MKQCNHFFSQKTNHLEESRKAQVQYLNEHYLSYLSKAEKINELQDNPPIQALLKH